MDKGEILLGVNINARGTEPPLTIPLSEKWFFEKNSEFTIFELWWGCDTKNLVGKLDKQVILRALLKIDYFWAMLVVL